MNRLEQLVNEGNVLKVLDYLKQFGISNKKISDISGVHFTTVHNYKKGLFEMGEDKQKQRLDTVREVFLNV